MRLSSRLFAALGLCLALGLPKAGLAHRFPECLSVISPGPERVEIVHRLHRHDVEQALSRLGDQTSGDLTELAVRGAFALYLESRFALANSAEPDLLLPLTLVGAELKDDQVLVYQESAQALPESLAVRSDVLLEVFPNQVNLVHVRTPDGTVRLSFAAGTGWQEVNMAANGIEPTVVVPTNQ